MKPAPKAAAINSATAFNPKTSVPTPAGVGKGPSGDAGPMSSADMGGAFSGAVAELRSQHPESYYDHGPHHGSTAHQRHKAYKLT